MAIKPFINALSGLKEAFKSQKNLRFHIFAAVIVVFAGFFLSVSLTEWILLLVVIMAVITCELFNTAIEYAVDLVCPELNEKARQVKDISAAAVLVTAIFAAVVGLFIFFPRLLIHLMK